MLQIEITCSNLSELWYYEASLLPLSHLMEAITRKRALIERNFSADCQSFCIVYFDLRLQVCQITDSQMAEAFQTKPQWIINAASQI